MAVRYWMISNRDVRGSGSRSTLGKERDELRFWVSEADQDKAIDSLSSWRKVDREQFQRLLVAAANRFPLVPESRNEDQKHVTIFVHGYNNSWGTAAKRYQGIVRDLFSAPSGDLGVCILFTWPSDGEVTGYLPDRRDARESANDLAEVLGALYDWLEEKQAETAAGGPVCRAKTSIIAHSMGNYVLQCAMHNVWTRKNQPLLVSLVNQLLMVAADVDNDLFKEGENIGDGDGEGIANLTYRITALYSGRDSVLGMSAGLKHFGKRRLGRSGLDRNFPLPDNVWDVDCTPFFAAGEKNIHSAYFTNDRTLELMRQALRGIDRDVLAREEIAPLSGPV